MFKEMVEPVAVAGVGGEVSPMVNAADDQQVMKEGRHHTDEQASGNFITTDRR